MDRSVHFPTTRAICMPYLRMHKEIAMRLKTFPLVAALVAVPGFAHAERLVNSPILARDVTTVNCLIQYVGSKVTPVPVRITIKEGPSVRRQDNTARLSRSTPSYSTAAACSRGQSSTCDNAICIFNFNGPKADFRASACVDRGDGQDNSGQLCLPAY